MNRTGRDYLFYNGFDACPIDMQARQIDHIEKMVCDPRVSTEDRKLFMTDLAILLPRFYRKNHITYYQYKNYQKVKEVVE